MHIKIVDPVPQQLSETCGLSIAIIPHRRNDQGPEGFVIAAERLSGANATPPRIILSSFFSDFESAIYGMINGFEVEGYAIVSDVADTVNRLIKDRVAIEL